MFDKFISGKLNRALGKGKKAIVAVGLAAGLLAVVACQQTVEVTREVEVTRVVTVTPLPTPTRAADWDALKNTAKEISYDDLFRNNEKWIGELVYYTAEVIQVLEGGYDYYQLRANVAKEEYSWRDNTIYLHYSGKRLLEEDVIEFVGEVLGLITYEAVMGRQITIPEISIIQSRRIR